MKISIKDEVVFLHPECDKDCYNLSTTQFSKCSIIFLRENDIPKPGAISHMEVPMSAFFEYLFAR